MTKRTPSPTHHDHMREFPRRELLKITVAAYRAGLEDIQREWPAEGLWDEDSKKLQWFNLAGRYKNKFFLIDFDPGTEENPITNAKDWIKTAEKENWAAKENIPLLNMRHFYTTQEMEIIIKKFLIKNTSG